MCVQVFCFGKILCGCKCFGKIFCVGKCFGEILNCFGEKSGHLRVFWDIWALQVSVLGSFGASQRRVRPPKGDGLVQTLTL